MSPDHSKMDSASESIALGIKASVHPEDEVIHDVAPQSGASKKQIIAGAVIGVAILAVVAVVLAVVVFADDSSSSSSATTVSAASSGSAASSVVVSVLPATSSSRRSMVDVYSSVRRSIDSYRRAYSDAGTAYSTYKTSQNVDVPGSDTLGTVNTIVCFVSSTGMFVVDPSSAPYEALVDMTPCQTGKRGNSKEVYTVTVYNTAAVTGGSPATYSGQVGFTMQGRELKAEASFSIFTVPVAQTCEGVPIDNDGTSKSCWTGSVKWVQGTGATQQTGSFAGSYSAVDPTYPGLLTFYESSPDKTPPRTETMVLALDSTGSNVRAKIGRVKATSEYFCLNANSNFARITSGASEGVSCATSSTGGQCLSRSSTTHYPFNYIPFDATTGAKATASGTVGLSMQYIKNSKECFAGISGGGAFMSCGSGQPSEADLIADGEAATDFASNAYTLHHSNAKVQKFVISELTIAEFASAYYISYYHWDNTVSKFYHYVLEHASSNTVFNAAFRREYSSNTWTDFVVGSGTVTIPSQDMNFWAAQKDARYYTGVDKPTSGQSWGKYQVQSESEYTYDVVNGKVYVAKSNGALQVTADQSLVCPVLCTRDNNGNCQEFTKCPKQAFAGMTLDTSSTRCTGSSCTSYDRTVDTAYQYKFKASDAQLYTTTNNAGTTVAEIKIDGRTGVTYSSNDQWAETTRSYMYPGTDATLFDTQAEVAAYHKVAGNVFYKVGVGMLGGYSGWTFYAKSAGSFVQLADPLSCSLTMETAFDANGGSSYNGAKFDLTFYGQQTSGLSWDQLSFGNANVGTRQRYVPYPQIANGALCVGSSASYRLKSEYTMIIPNEAASGSCSAWDVMVSAGTLPTVAETPANAAATNPTTTKVCVSETTFTNEAGCTYAAGTTSTKG